MAGLTEVPRRGPTDREPEWPTLSQRCHRRRADLAYRWSREPGRLVEAGVSVVAVVVATWVIVAALNPGEVWRDTTPTGGDMGAHVWGPRFLLDNVIENFRLTGWTGDWYNGFPAYQFYMVVPSMMIVALHVGLPAYLAVAVVAVAAAVAVAGWGYRRLHPYRYLLATVAVSVAVLAVPVPYNRAFKLVTVMGLVGMPLACWAFAKLADLPFPIPPLVAVVSLLFVFNREPLYNNTGNIIGGNFQSTMAGEFAFSVSLTLAILYLGVAARGIRTGRHRGLAAVLFALAGLCHLIPAFFVLACTAALVVVHPDRGRIRWLATMVPVAGLLTAFWVVPFWWRRDYVNDMGWERLPSPNAEALSTEAQNLSGDQSSVWYYLFPSGMRWLLVFAVVGVVLSLLRRYAVGMVLAMAWVGVLVVFWALPQTRLWNARLLPFMYLSVALLAAIGIGELIRIVAAAANGRPHAPLRWVSVPPALVVVAGVFIYTVLPIGGILDGPVSVRGRTISVLGRTWTPIERQRVTVELNDGTTEDRTESTIFGRFATTASHPGKSWSAWNYRGLELKEPTDASGGWPEYRDLVATMAALGEDPDHGCGRALWEFEADRINGYGTTMAPMLFPYWTDGCIGSQEGLYFESSSTVPHHFLMLSELSARPSTPQREMPYPSFDMDRGVAHLQMMGVRYYLAVSDRAVSAAAEHRDLTEVAVSGPWHVYEVHDAPLVAPLTHAPVVAEGQGEGQHDWLPVASAWFLDPDQHEVPIAPHGPDDWERVQIDTVPADLRALVRWTRDQLGEPRVMDPIPDLPRTELPPIEVTDIDSDHERISFSVSEVGVPVVVRTSYFPNWQVEGGEGPYRITPNLMVVVPTATEVTLTYGRTPVDVVAMAMSVLGLVGLVLLARARPVEVDELEPFALSRRLDELITIETPDRDHTDFLVEPPPEGGGDLRVEPPQSGEDLRVGPPENDLLDPSADQPDDRGSSLPPPVEDGRSGDDRRPIEAERGWWPGARPREQRRGD